MLSRNFKSQSELRRYQIDTLKIFNDNVTEIKEGFEYKLSFVSGRNELIITVKLSDEFPSERPDILVSPIIIHPWVDSEGKITGAPGLLNYTVHSDLGRVVRAIIGEFERSNPQLIVDLTSGATASCVQSLEMEQLGRVSPLSNNYSLSATYSQQRLHSFYFPNLDKLDLNELRLLNDSEDQQDEFLDNLTPIVELNKNIDDTITQIEELAESNLNKENTLEHLKNEVFSRIDTLTSLRNNHEILNQKYQTISDRYAPNNIKNLLQEAATKSNEESETIAESFLDGQINVETFLDKYLNARSLAQERKTKEEKLSHQLNELQRAGF